MKQWQDIQVGFDPEVATFLDKADKETYEMQHETERKIASLLYGSEILEKVKQIEQEGFDTR
jgi:hypothetical protein